MLPCAAAATRVAAGRIGGEMSAVGELVQGERRGRWLVVAVACAAVLAWAAAPARAADATIPGSPLTIYANDNGQLQVAFNGSATGEFFPRSLAPANAGVNVARRAARDRTPFTVFGFRGHAVHCRTRLPRRSPATAAPATRGCSRTNYRTDTPAPTCHRRRREAHLRQRDDGRRRPVHACSNVSTAPRSTCASTRRPTSTSPATTPASASSTRARRARSAASTRRPGSSARLVEQTPAWTHYQEGRYSDVFDVDRQHDRRRQPSTTRSTRRSSTTASACSGTSPAWRRTRRADVPRRLALQPLHRRSTLAARPPTQAHGPDRDGDGHARATATATPIRAARCATRSPAPTRAPAR